MQTFDAALFDLYNEDHIAFEEAIRNSDSANELRIAIKLKSKRGMPALAGGPTFSMQQDEKPADKEEKKEEAKACGEVTGCWQLYLVVYNRKCSQVKSRPPFRLIAIYQHRRL